MRMVRMAAVIAAVLAACASTTASADGDSSDWFHVDTTEPVAVGSSELFFVDTTEPMPAVGISEWFFVDTVVSVAVHFDANGGEGATVTQVCIFSVLLRTPRRTGISTADCL